MTFANALRAFLRQDPDVIMVGEMRDQETASVGIQASLTGHLVLTTLHTNTAAAAITRLIDLIEPVPDEAVVVGARRSINGPEIYKGQSAPPTFRSAGGDFALVGPDE
jgi:Tfp pilus assembly pilus retraction ATPase PilT